MRMRAAERTSKAIVWVLVAATVTIGVPTFGIGGLAPASAASAVTPPAGSYFHSLAPSRVLDSRGSNGGWNAKLSAAAPRSLTVTGGTANVPVDATAVVVNVTVTEGSANSFLSVFPAGGTVPNVSNINFAAGETIPNLVTVKVGTAGQISFANAVGSVHVIADLVGYYGPTAADRYNPVLPFRLYYGLGDYAHGGIKAGAPRSFQVSGLNGIASSATAVIMNVTVTNPTANSFLTVFPAGGPAPNASNVNFGTGQTIANLVTVKLGTGGQITIANAVGSAVVVLDVVGYYDAGAGDLFHPLPPVRILDSRGLVGGFGGKVPAGLEPRTLQVAGVGGVPADATAVVGNVTVTEADTGSFLSVYPSGLTFPPCTMPYQQPCPTPYTTSILNFGTGQTIANLDAVKLGGGKIDFANAVGTVHAIFDVVGYFATT